MKSNILVAGILGIIFMCAAAMASLSAAADTAIAGLVEIQAQERTATDVYLDMSTQSNASTNTGAAVMGGMLVVLLLGGGAAFHLANRQISTDFFKQRRLDHKALNAPPPRRSSPIISSAPVRQLPVAEPVSQIPAWTEGNYS